MMRWTVVALVLLVGCTPTARMGADGAVSSTSDFALNASYLAIAYCVDHAARIATPAGGAPSRDDLAEAMETCEPMIDRYIDAVAERTRRDNRWTSLHSSVRPALRRAFAEGLVAQLQAAY